MTAFLPFIAAATASSPVPAALEASIHSAERYLTGIVARLPHRLSRMGAAAAVYQALAWYGSLGGGGLAPPEPRIKRTLRRRAASRAVVSVTHGGLPSARKISREEPVMKISRRTML